MFWHKPKPAPAETAGGDESRPSKRGKRIIPAAITASLVSAAILSGCGETDSQNTEKLPENSVVAARIKQPREQITKGMAKALRPVAVDIARRALKISADQNSHTSRFHYPYDYYLDDTVNVNGGIKKGSVAEEFYIDVGTTNGKPDPRKVEYVQLNISRANKLGTLNQSIDISNAYRDKQGKGHPWEAGSSLYLHSTTQDEATCYPPYPRPKVIPDYPDSLPPPKPLSPLDLCVSNAQIIAAEADIMFTDIAKDIQG